MFRGFTTLGNSFCVAPEASLSNDSRAGWTAAPYYSFTLGDSAELREVALNLIFNAVDAMPNGGTIEAGTRIEGKTARFWIADTGNGMPAEVIARIFEPFYTTKGERGTGLGLSASHGIIENHSGDINVISEPGKGTRFEIILPLHESVAPVVGTAVNSHDLALRIEEVGLRADRAGGVEGREDALAPEIAVIPALGIDRDS